MMLMTWSVALLLSSGDPFDDLARQEKNHEPPREPVEATATSPMPDPSPNPQPAPK